MECDTLLSVLSFLELIFLELEAEKTDERQRGGMRNATSQREGCIITNVAFSGNSFARGRSQSVRSNAQQVWNVLRSLSLTARSPSVREIRTDVRLLSDCGRLV